MSRRPGVTFAIPSIPPRGQLLHRAVESVQRQTVPAAGLSIAVDVGRLGAWETRQQALDGVTTEWVHFLDDDDELKDPEHTAKLLAHAAETGADYVYSWYRIVGHGGVVQEHDYVFPPGHFLDPWDPERPRQTTITVLVRTDLAKTVGFVYPAAGEEGTGQRWGEDFTFTLGCNRLGKISHLVEKTWLWHHDPPGGNTSGMPDRW